MVLRAVHKNRDCQKVVADRQFAAGKDRPRRDTELMIAAFAFPKAAGFVELEGVVLEEI
jgi:hypothetical protein